MFIELCSMLNNFYYKKGMICITSNVQKKLEFNNWRITKYFFRKLLMTKEYSNCITEFCKLQLTALTRILTISQIGSIIRIPKICWKLQSFFR